MNRGSGVRLSTAMAWFAASYLAALVGYLAVQAVAGRMLGEAGFGHFTLVMTTVAILGQIGLVGAHRVGLRELPSLRRQVEEGEDRSRELGEIGRGSRAVLLTTLPVVATLAGLVTWLSPVGDHRLVFAVAVVLLVWSAGAVLLFAHLARGMGRVAVSGLLEGRSGGAVAAVSQVSALGVAWTLFPDAGLMIAVPACAVAGVVPVVVGAAATRSVFGQAGRLSGQVANAIAAARRGWRFASNQVAALVNATTELWLASVFLGAAATSFFGAATRLSFFLAIPTTVVAVVISPVVAREINAGNLRRLEPVVRAAATVAALGSLIILVPMLVAPTWVMTTILGPELAPAADLLRILALGMLIPVFAGQAGTVLTMSHHEGAMATMAWATAGLRVLTGSVAVALFGVTGLAVSAAVSTAALGVGSWLLARRRVGISTHASARPRLKTLREVAAV
jgi:O-antigen/teichoic acid export membrane protein